MDSIFSNTKSYLINQDIFFRKKIKLFFHLRKYITSIILICFGPYVVRPINEKGLFDEMIMNRTAKELLVFFFLTFDRWLDPSFSVASSRRR